MLRAMVNSFSVRFLFSGFNTITPYVKGRRCIGIVVNHRAT